MRRRIPYRVCSCTPSGIVTHLEARLLRQLVNREIHPIRCAQSCRQKFMKGMRIGDLCAETGHFAWAQKIWGWTEQLIEEKDWEDWRYVWFNPKRVSLRDVVSETECELLSRRRSDLWRALGQPDMAWWDEHWNHVAASTYGSYYSCLWAEKYDTYPVETLLAYEEQQQACQERLATERLFSEALGDNLPACAHDFYEYWQGDR